MKILTAAYYEFLKNIRDVKMSVFLWLFPLLTIYILGNVIGGYFSEDVSNRISVGYLNEDKGLVGVEFDKFLENPEIKSRLDITAYTDKGLGLQDIDRGNIDIMIHLPENLSDKLLQGDRQSINLYGKNNIAFIQSLTNGFVSSYNSLGAVAVVSGNPVLPDREDTIKRIFYKEDNIMPEVIDYYSVLTLLQMLIVGAIFGVFIVNLNKESDMHIRINSLPVSRLTLIIGRVIGSVTYLFLGSIFIILFTKYVYKANWSGNPAIILGTLLIFCIISVGIGIVTGTLVKSFSSSLMIILLLMMVFATLSGAITPVSAEGFLSNLSPNTHAKIIIFGTIYGYSREVMLEAALWLVGFITVIYSIAIALVRRVKHDNI